MSKAIVYSLFGSDRAKYENCFTFETYLTGLMLSIRCNRLVFSEWTNVLETDKVTYEAYKDIFKALEENGSLIVERNENDRPLCEAMLWRLKPMYWKKGGEWQFTHILCRDLDSLSTYREAQAVAQWVANDTAVHAITDSVSHGIPMLGGMIGFRPHYVPERLGTANFQDLLNKRKMDFTGKGSDQTFLNDIVYPAFGQKGTDSITQHYFKGHGNTWLSHFYSCNCWLHECRQGHKPGCPLDVPLDIPIELKETNEVSEHMGASGWNQTQTMALIQKYKDRFRDLDAIEKPYKQIFYWQR